MARNRPPDPILPIYYGEHGWHLDRRVPLALLCGLFVQLMAGVYWASGMSHDMAQVKTNIAGLTEDAKIKATAINQIAELKTEQKYIRETLERLERAVERLSPSQHPPRYNYRSPKVPLQ